MFDPSPEDAVTMDEQTLENFLKKGVWLPKWSEPKRSVFKVEDKVFEKDVPIVNTEEDMEKLRDGKMDELDTIHKTRTIKGYDVQREVYYDMQDDEMTVYRNHPRKHMGTFFMGNHDEYEDIEQDHEVNVAIRKKEEKEEAARKLEEEMKDAQDAMEDV
ncbi:MAG: hypothetical protein CMB80_05865 [Flammeovirgaceae bacterium]|nr:hypothetical protein [Flammeovirgaceae bacterium]|tara:strand:- start:1121 stop:1597 length:477 start_codon:yes stop_codon:yes gene_type:complete